MAEKLSTMERIANALAMLGQATHAIQNTSIAVTHVANHHEVLHVGGVFVGFAPGPGRA